MDYDMYEKKLDKLISKFIHRSKKFIKYSATPDGLIHLLLYQEQTTKLTYDHEYLNFTKSTKSLISIRELLKINHNEDVLILTRSIFENYLSTRYLNENEKFIDEIVKMPSLLFSAEYNIDREQNVINREKEIVGKLLNPSSFKTGKDSKYYTFFYSYLSAFSHSNFGVATNYLDNWTFTINNNKDPLLVRFFVVFVFSKLFEHIVTVDGEDFYNENEELKSYKLVEESLKLQNEVIPLLLTLYTENNKEDYFNIRMQKILKNMRKSLKEEIGSDKIKRDFLE